MWENSKFYTHIYDWNWSWHHLSKQKLILWPNQADGWQLMFSFLRKSRPYASSDTNQQDSMSKPGPSWVFPLHLFYLLSCCSSSRKIKWLDAFSLKNRKKILAATLLSTRGCAFLYWNRSAFSVHSSWCLPHQSSPAVLLVSLNLCTSPVHIIFVQDSAKGLVKQHDVTLTVGPSENWRDKRTWNHKNTWTVTLNKSLLEAETQHLPSGNTFNLPFEQKLQCKSIYFCTPSSEPHRTRSAEFEALSSFDPSQWISAGGPMSCKADWCASKLQ